MITAMHIVPKSAQCEYVHSESLLLHVEYIILLTNNPRITDHEI